MQETETARVFLRLRAYRNGYFMIQSPYSRGNTFIPRDEWIGAIIELKDLWSIPYSKCKHPDGYWVFPPQAVLERGGTDQIKQDIIDAFKVQGWDVTVLGPAAISDDFDDVESLT